MLDKRKTNRFFSHETWNKRLIEFISKGDCYPVDVVIHPTTRCNHRCNFCYHFLNLGKKPHSEIDKNRFIDLTGELKDIGVENLIISGGGEPVVHPDIRQLLDTCILLFPSSSIYTNLDYPLDTELITLFSQIGRINVNINTTNENLYRDIRGKNANLERVIENLRTIATKQKNITATVIVREDTLGTLEQTIMDLQNLGMVNVHVSPAFKLKYKDCKDSKGYPPISEELKRRVSLENIKLLEPEADAVIDKDGKVFCNTHYFDITIGADLGVYPCCNVSYITNYQIINLRDFDSFKDAWNSELRKERISKARYECYSCWFAPVNRFIMEKKK